MSKLRYITTLLQPHCTYASSYTTRPNNLVSIKFLKKQVKIHQGVIHLCSEDFALASFSENTLLPGCVFVVCGSDGKKVQSLCEGVDSVVFCVALPVADVYELLNDYLAQFSYWSESFWRAIATRTTKRDFINLLAGLSNGICVTLDERNNPVYNSDATYEPDWLIDYRLGIGPFSHPAEIIHAGNYSDYCTEYFDPARQATFFCCNCSTSAFHGTIVLVTKGQRQEQDCVTLLLLGIRAFCRLLSMDAPVENDIYAKNQILFSQALALATNHRKTRMTAVERENAFARLAFPIQSRLRCGVISLQLRHAEVLPYDVVGSELKDILPGVNFCCYNDHYVVLFSCENGSSWMDAIDMDSFRRMLIRFNTAMCISEEFSDIGQIGPFLSACSDALHLRSTLGFDRDAPIIFLRDYLFELQTYYAVKYQYRFAAGTGPVYLCDPAVLALHRQDQADKTSYFEFLMDYLAKGDSLAQTAQRMYIHRNTAQKWLRKICARLGRNENELQQEAHSIYASCVIIKVLESRNLL